MVGVLSNKNTTKPEGISYMILYVAFERFAFYGTLVILIMYMRQILKYSEDHSVLLFHAFGMLTTILPVLGAILAESILGKYNMLVMMSILHAAGLIMLTLASTSISTTLDEKRLTSLIALAMIFAGSGLAKPSFVGFGGEQFVQIQQESLMIKFFSQILVMLNIATLMAKIATPSLRQDYQCDDMTTCYKLAFAFCSASMILATFLFSLGRKYYRINPTEKGAFLLACKCICHAMCKRMRGKQANREHWLQYADDKYDPLIIKETRNILHMLHMFLPMPIYWALYLQMHSRWIIQATYMNGDFGFYMVKPDHMPLFSPVVMIICVPLLSNFFPCVYKIHLCRTSLQKMAFGGFLTATAFLISGFLELELEESYPVKPFSGEAHIRMFNGFECASVVRIPELLNEGLDQFDMCEILHITATGTRKLLNSSATLSEDCLEKREFWSGVLIAKEKMSISYLITFNSDGARVVATRASEKDDFDKSLEGKAKIRLLYKLIDPNSPVYLIFLDPEGDKVLESYLWPELVELGPVELHHKSYKVMVNDTEIMDVQLDIGAVYTLLVQENDVAGNIGSELFILTPPSTVNILWQIPQIVVLTLGEMLVTIPAMEFSFSQISPAMKSVVQSIWAICLAVGNIIIMAAACIRIFDRKAFEYFMFATLMVINMTIFSILAKNYKFITYSDDARDIPAKYATPVASKPSVPGPVPNPTLPSVEPTSSFTPTSVQD